MFGIEAGIANSCLRCRIAVPAHSAACAAPDPSDMAARIVCEPLIGRKPRHRRHWWERQLGTSGWLSRSRGPGLCAGGCDTPRSVVLVLGSTETPEFRNAPLGAAGSNPTSTQLPAARSHAVNRIARFTCQARERVREDPDNLPRRHPDQRPSVEPHRIDTVGAPGIPRGTCDVHHRRSRGIDRQDANAPYRAKRWIVPRRFDSGQLAPEHCDEQASVEDRAHQQSDSPPQRRLDFFR